MDKTLGGKGAWSGGVVQGKKLLWGRWLRKGLLPYEV